MPKNCFRFASLIVNDICLEEPETVEAFIPLQDELLSTQAMMFIGPKLIEYGILTSQIIQFVQ